MSNLRGLRPVDLPFLALFQANGPFGVERAPDAPKRPPPGLSIEVDGVTFNVRGIYCKGGEETAIDPPEPECFDIDSIHIGDVEVTKLVREWASSLWDHLEAQCLAESVDR